MGFRGEKGHAAEQWAMARSCGKRMGNEKVTWRWQDNSATQRAYGDSKGNGKGMGEWQVSTAKDQASAKETRRDNGEWKGPKHTGRR